MKTLAVATKSLIELFREPLLLAMVILTPLAFLLLYATAYQTPTLKTYTVLVLQSGPGSDAILDFLSAQTYADGRPVFRFVDAGDRASAEEHLRNRAAAALLILDAGAENVAIIRGDAVQADFLTASTMLESRLADYADSQLGRTPVERTREAMLPGAPAGARTDFYAYSPGLLVFAILLLVPQTALLLGREIRVRTIRRLRLSGISAAEYLGGVTISQLVVAALQVVLITVGLLAFGLDPFRALGPILLASLVLAFSGIGIGLLVGCFVQNDSQAVNLGSVVTMIQVFMSGAFFPIPAPTLFRWLGHEIMWNDFLPATHIMIALQQSMVYGVSIDRLWFRLTAALVLTLGILLTAVVAYRQKVMRAAATQAG